MLRPRGLDMAESAAMPLSAGTRIGAYDITGSLGAGGMGEVYRRPAALRGIADAVGRPVALVFNSLREKKP